VPRLIRPHVLRPAGRVQGLGVVAASKCPHASTAMNASQAPTTSAFTQNARGSPPLAVRTIHALRSRSTSARFSSAGGTPVDAMTINRALVFASVRLAAASRKIFAGARTFADGATGSGATSSDGVGTLGAVEHAVHVAEGLHAVVDRLRRELVLEPRTASLAHMLARDLRPP
jgi:hypothetical protein